MSKRRRRRNPKQTRPRITPGRKAGRSDRQSLAELASQFGTVDSLGAAGGSPDEDGMLDGAVGRVQRDEYARIWREHRTATSDGEDESDAARPEDLDSDPDGEDIEQEDERIFQAMTEHPEFEAYFDDPEQLDGDGCTPEGVNPFVHVSLHGVVEGQLAGGTPPEVLEILEALQTAGLSRHEGVHEIALAVTEQMHQMLSENREFDAEAYLKSLTERVAEAQKRAP